MDKNKGISHIFVNIFIGAFIVLALFVAYFYVKEDNAELVPTGEGEAIISQTELEAQRIFNVIDEISKIELRRDIILRSDFENLQDLTTPIPVQQAGTPSPFDKIKF